MKKLFALLIFPALSFCKAHAQTDMAIVDVFPLDYQVPGSHSFEVAVRTLGPQGFGIFNISWQLGTAAVQTITVPAGGAPQGHVTSPAFTVSFPAAGTYTLKLWVKSTTPVDPNASNDTIIKTIHVFGSLPKKNVVLENFKHLNCCPCYPAACYEDTVISTNNAYAIVNIYSVSNDPAVYNVDGNTVNDVYNSGHPEPIFDRFKIPYQPDIFTGFFTGPNGYGLDGYGLREQYYEPVKVSFKSMIYNATTRQMKVKLNAQFYDELSGDYRFNLYLTEDSILQYQACAPDPNNYYHMHVLRQMLGGPWGLAGSLPAALHTNDQKEYEFTYTLPASYNTSHLNLVGMVQTYNADSSKRRILNSDKITFRNALTLAVNTLPALKDLVKIYPNPAADKLTVSLSNRNNTSYTITLIDMTGKTITTVYTTATTNIDTHALAAGNYLVRVDDGKEVFTQLIRKE